MRLILPPHDVLGLPRFAPPADNAAGTPNFELEF
jgi:hypothetical protein